MKLTVEDLRDCLQVEGDGVVVLTRQELRALCDLALAQLERVPISTWYEVRRVTPSGTVWRRGGMSWEDTRKVAATWRARWPKATTRVVRINRYRRGKGAKRA